MSFVIKFLGTFQNAVCEFDLLGVNLVVIADGDNGLSSSDLVVDSEIDILNFPIYFGRNDEFWLFECSDFRNVEICSKL